MEKTKSSCGLPLLIAGLLMLGCLGLGFIAVLLGGSGGSSDRSVEAYVLCKKIVSDRLKAPTTAKWETGKTTYEMTVQVTGTGQDTYRVISYVDAENSFGAMLRTHFTCQVSYAEPGGWKLDYVNFDQP